jgi:putative transposase
MSWRIRLLETDMVMIGDSELRLVEQSTRELSLRDVRSPDVVRSFSHAEFHALLQKPEVRLKRGFYDETEVRRRLAFDKLYLESVTPSQRRVILWKSAWCEEFLRAELAGKIQRTELSISSTLSTLRNAVDERERQRQGNGGTPRAGNPLTLKAPPHPKTLLRWVRRYERAGHSPLALARTRSKTQIRTIESYQAREALLQDCVQGYQERNRPTMEIIVANTAAAFRKANEERAREGRLPLEPPSASTIRRRIRQLDPFETYAQRHGAEAARKKFRPYRIGVSTLAPLERVEMDEWRIDLMTILDEGGAFDGAPSELRERFRVGRRWLYVAIDVATRCILSMRLCEKPTPEDAVRSLDLITVDKTAISDAVGCECAWDQFGGIGTLVSDQGPSFVSDMFRTAVADLGATVETPPAGLAEMRATVERVFRTFGVQLMPWLSGRTFSNVVDRGDYPSESLAVFTDDELSEILVRYVVDGYHNSPHAGLGGETPANAWQRLCEEVGKLPAPDAIQRRYVFGIPGVRKVERHGTCSPLSRSCRAAEDGPRQVPMTNGPSTASQPRQLCNTSIPLWRPVAAQSSSHCRTGV